MRNFSMANNQKSRKFFQKVFEDLFYFNKRFSSSSALYEKLQYIYLAIITVYTERSTLTVLPHGKFLRSFQDKNLNAKIEVTIVFKRNVFRINFTLNSRA